MCPCICNLGYLYDNVNYTTTTKYPGLRRKIVLITEASSGIGATRTPSPDLWLVPGHYQDTSREGRGWKRLI